MPSYYAIDLNGNFGGAFPDHVAAQNRAPLYAAFGLNGLGATGLGPVCFCDLYGRMGSLGRSPQFDSAGAECKLLTACAVRSGLLRGLYARVCVAIATPT